MSTPRVRIFAGPNGSGKSTFNSKVPAHLLVNYINPDAIELGIRETGKLDFARFKLQLYADQALPFLRASHFLKNIDIVSDTQPAWFKRYVLDKLT